MYCEKGVISPVHDRSQTHVLAQQFLSRWHVAYCAVPTTRVAGVMRTGQLPTTHSTGEVVLSPDIQTAYIVSPSTPMRWVYTCHVMTTRYIDRQSHNKQVNYTWNSYFFQGKEKTCRRWDSNPLHEPTALCSVGELSAN